MTKHIPTDIDSMTRKELSELCKIQFDENQKLAMDLVASYGENQTLLKQIEQLQRERDKRDIEQQIKGIKDAIKQAPSKAKYALPLIETLDLYDYIEQLRKQLQED